MTVLLSGDRLAAIREALLAMKASKAAAAAWEAIRAPDKPALGASIEWALAEIGVEGCARPDL